MQWGTSWTRRWQLTGPPAAREDAVEVKVLGRSGMVQGRGQEYPGPGPQQLATIIISHPLSSTVTDGMGWSLTLLLPVFVNTSTLVPQLVREESPGFPADTLKGHYRH